MDKIDEFFAQYPDFNYNRTGSSPREFYRMCDQFHWVKDSQGDYPPEREAAREAFREAMVETFNGRFGTDANDKKAWEGICDLLGIEPLPESMDDMRKVRQPCFIL
jgi:hypothetical protein